MTKQRGGARTAKHWRSLLLAPVLLAVVAPALQAQDWAARFPPHPDCRLRLPDQAERRARGASQAAAVVIRPVVFGTNDPVRPAAVAISLRGAPDPPPPPANWTADTTSAFVFEHLASGTYVVSVRALGYARRIDTITVPAGGLEVRVPLATFSDGYRNRFNCRPRGFRRTGQRACVTEGEEAAVQLDEARSLARADERRRFRLPVGDSTDVRIVSDEGLCDLAARLYGDSSDPPRRVILIRMGELYLVYDPFEPLEAGEWSLRKIFDARWQLVVALTW